MTWDCITTLYALSRLYLNIVDALRKATVKWPSSGKLEENCAGHLPGYFL